MVVAWLPLISRELFFIFLSVTKCLLRYEYESIVHRYSTRNPKWLKMGGRGQILDLTRPLTTQTTQFDTNDAKRNKKGTECMSSYVLFLCRHTKRHKQRKSTQITQTTHNLYQGASRFQPTPLQPFSNHLEFLPEAGVYFILTHPSYQ